MILMRKSLLLVLLMLVSCLANAAPASSYVFSAFAGTFSTINGTSGITNVSTVQADDATSSGIPIGFTFNFCGVNYTSVSVCSNGWLSFNSTLTTTALNNASTAGNLGTIAPCVMPLWDDLDGRSTTSNASSANYITTGSSPNRVFTMEWSNWEWNFSANNDVITFQVKLYEGTNRIQFVYSQNANAVNTASGGATIGIANSAADYKMLNNSSTTPTAASIYVDTITVKPATGQVYQWDPPPPCSGTPTAGTAYPSGVICPNVAFTIFDTGATIASSLNYAWQSSPAGANTWTTIPGAVTPTYTVAAGISAATDFRFVDTCTVSNLSAISNTITWTLNTPLNCYCTQAAGSTVDDDIGQVKVGSFANPTTTPTPLTGNSNSTAQYTNYTALGPIKVIAGAATPFQATQINSGSYYTCYMKAFVDLNRDGDWVDANEQVFSQAGLGSAASPSFTGTITVPATTTPGTARMRVTLQESGSSTSVTPCNTYTWGETEDYTLIILSSTPPPPTLVHNAPVCPGGTLTFTAADTAGYPNPTFTLYGPGIPSAGVNMPGGVYSITNVTAAAAGMYYATETSNGFTSTVQTPTNPAVTIYPAANIVTGTIVGSTTCTSLDGSFQLTGLVPNAQYTISYTDPNNAAKSVGPITASSSGTYTVTGLGSGTYTNIKVNNSGTGSGNCASNTIATINVPPPFAPPTPIITYQQPLCPGSTLQLTVTNANPNGTYSWTTDAAGTWNNPTPGTGPTASRNNITAAQNGNYCAIVSVTGCKSLKGCVNVAVTPKDPKPTGPGIAPNNPIQYCQFDLALPLTASGTKDTFYGPWQVNPLNPSGPLYTGPDSAKIYRLSITPRTDIATGPGQAFVYGVTQTVTCTSDTAYILVQVKPRPPKPTVQSPIEFCQFSPANPLSASGQNIRWFTTPTGGVGTATAPTPNTLVSGTYYFYASQTVNGCEGDRAIVVVTVKPKPAPPKVTSPLNLCQGDPVGPLTAIGQNLLWYTVAAGGVGVPVAPIPNTGYEDSFKYWVSQTVNGCESDRALIQAYVRYKPNGVIVGASQSVCQDAEDTFYYYGNARPDAEYVWFSPFPQTHAVAGKNSPGPFIVHFDSAGTQVIRLQINNNGCISTLISAPITVRHLPKFDYSLKRDVCKDELVDISLIFTEPKVSDYAFSFGNTTDTTMVYAAPPGGPFGIRYHTAGDYIVAATATLDQCTSKPLEKRITVHDLPNAGISALAYDPKSHTLAPFDAESDVICSSDTLVLSVPQVEEGATYTWTPVAYFQSLRDTLNYIVRAVVGHSSPVNVRVVTAYGCVGEDSIVVNTKPCCGVFFPTAFAPEGNVAQNRTFKPITIGFHDVNNFRVVNRWGQTVFETKNERIGWDGTYNGVKQDMGVYYYYINYRCEGKNMEEHGEVTLMR